MFWEVFDQFRFMAGTILAELVFVIHTVPKKKNFVVRSIGCFAVCLIFSLTLLPVYRMTQRINFMVLSISSCIWWLAASFAAIGYILFCYEITLCHALFRGILGLALQQVITVVLRYYIADIWYPDFQNQYPLYYIVLTIVLYLIFCICAYFLLARRMQDIENADFMESKKILYRYIFFILIFSLVSDVTGGIYEWVLSVIEEVGNLKIYAEILRYFCMGMLLVICLVIFLIQYNMYEIVFLRQEREFLKRLSVEKEKQYERSKENIDLINQKCHDLKHQLQGLKFAKDSEREALIDETESAIQFYDAVVKTGNEVLNTILTEKSLICTRHRIRLSCMVTVSDMGTMSVVDLYSILGNALDNAIEHVSGYEKEEKKVISLSITKNANLLCIMVDNYFDGKLQLKNGLPVTSKEDKDYHGYGLKSIRMIARKYGGDMRISHIGCSFSLQVMIPMSDIVVEKK